MLGCASSVMSTQGFDNIKTIEVAIEYGFKAVQPYINQALYDQAYRTKFIDLLAHNDIQVIIHLPDLDKISNNDINVATDITKRLLVKNKFVKTLIHYHENVDLQNIPLINERMIGIENSYTGNFDSNSIRYSFDLSRKMDTFFVFDPHRIMFTSSIQEANDIKEFILSTINRLDPKKDILHMIDKKSWDGDYRVNGCFLGHPEGISQFMIPSLKKFHNEGGIIIFEYENIEMAVESMNSLTS